MTFIVFIIYIFGVILIYIYVSDITALCFYYENDKPVIKKT